MHRQAPRAVTVGRHGGQEPPRGLVEPRRALRWKPDRPGQITGPPVTAAIEKTADPADGQTDEQPRGNAISQSRERQTSAAGKPPGSQCCRRQRPKHHQTSGRDIEHSRKRLRPTPSGGEKLIVVFDYIEESRADDAPEEHLHAECQDRIGIEAHAAAPHDREPGAGRRGDQQHRPITPHRHALAVVERRKQPEDRRRRDRQRHSQCFQSRPPAVAGGGSRQHHRRRDSPHGQEESEANQRQRHSPHGDPRRDVKQRRQHQRARP